MILNMTAQDKLKKYFYNHIINHKDFDLSEYTDNLELPKTFDELIDVMNIDNDWYDYFEIYNLEYDFINEIEGTTYIYKVDEDLFISAFYSRYIDLDTCKYVKQVEVTVTQWKEYERS